MAVLSFFAMFTSMLGVLCLQENVFGSKTEGLSTIVPATSQASNVTANISESSGQQTPRQTLVDSTPSVNANSVTPNSVTADIVNADSATPNSVTANSVTPDSVTPDSVTPENVTREKCCDEDASSRNLSTGSNSDCQRCHDVDQSSYCTTADNMTQSSQDDVTRSSSPGVMSSTTRTTTKAPPSRGPETIAEIRQLMELTGLVPLAVIGLVLNCLSLWVWCADKAYNTTTFLFKFLAVWDNLCLITLILFLSKLNPLLTKVSLSISNVSQRMSVHTTMLVSITRWLAVSRPLHVKAMLPAARVRVICVALVFWCLLVEGLYFYSTYAELDRETSWAIYYMQRVVGLALPLVVMFIFNILLVSKTRQSRQGVGLTNQQQGSEARYRLTQAAVCISVCSLIAYPISIITEVVFNIRCYQGNVYVCDRLFVYSIKFTTFVLQVINLGINFIFYVAFASRFRQLLFAKMLCCRRHRHSSSSETPAPASTLTSVEGSIDKRVRE